MTSFVATVWEYYQRHGRHDLPWRQFAADETINPYHILVSELMLQQTQVPRVVPKFLAFVEAFPDLEALANAPLAEVLKAWSGLGYNRRAKYLWQAAQMVVKDYGGTVPNTAAELITLPGVGPNTAGALLAYAYNQPVLFIETNIRTVFIHHFFATEQQISDQQILDLLEKTFPDHWSGRAVRDQIHFHPGATGNPEGVSRDWYWALMDYGTYLKQTFGNVNVQSKHYTKQSRFEGSKRQVRGQVLRVLLAGPMDFAALATVIADERLSMVLESLLHEGLIATQGRRYKLAD